MTQVKVLQIIHVTDLHFGVEGVNEQTRHLRELNRNALRLARALRHHNVFGFAEGTQTHFRRAPEAFLAFIEDQRSADPEWFEAATWIVDTGDLTTYGDPASIAAGKQFLQSLCAACGNAMTLQLYGNHDAWPATHPATTWYRYYEELVAQRGVLTTYPEWQPQRWLSAPLRVRVGTSDSSIELYGLDTIAWEGLRNLRAVGSIDPRAITELQERIDARHSTGHLHDFRLLASHHPVAFPYEAEEVRAFTPLIDQMRLAGAAQVAHRLGVSHRPLRRGPYIHLILSGHTHLRYPAQPLSPAASLTQRGLTESQLQLVGSSLMLNKSRGTGALPTPALPKPSNRIVRGFGPVVAGFPLLRTRRFPRLWTT